MQGLQVGIGVVGGEAQPIASQVDRIGGLVAAGEAGRQRRIQAAFIDVVAQEHDQVGLLFGHMPVGAEISALPVGAGGEGEVQPVHLLAGRWGGAGAADRALLPHGGEAIPVGPVRLQAGDLDVSGVCETAVGLDVARLDDVAHALVSGDLPPDRDRRPQPAQTVRRQRLGRHAGPDHEAIGDRITGGDAKREGLQATGGGPGRQGLGGDEASGGPQHAPPGDPALRHGRPPCAPRSISEEGRRGK